MRLFLQILDHFIEQIQHFDNSHKKELCDIYISLKSSLHLSKICENDQSCFEFILQTDFLSFIHPWFLIKTFLKFGSFQIQTSVLQLIDWNLYFSEFENSSIDLSICLFDLFDLVLIQYPQVISDQSVLSFLEKVFNIGLNLNFQVYVHSISPLLRIAQMKNFTYLETCFQFNIVGYLTTIIETEFEIVSQVFIFFGQLLTLHIPNLKEIFISNEIQRAAEQNLDNEIFGHTCQEFLLNLINIC